jgi:hypothetical protein
MQTVSNEQAAERVRNTVSSEKKVNVLGRLARGESCASASRLVDVESTVKTTSDNKNSI